jgi:CRISPR-associated exonuclease Cas4
VDNLIKIDVAEGGEKVHEVKLSRKMEQAHRYQLLYYLYFLKQLGITGLVGEINYPRLRRKEEVRLLPEQEAFLEKALEQIQQVKSLATPPEAQLTSLCRRCSYQELCWG